MKISIMMFVASIISATAFTQNIVKGKVIDKNTREPLEYVTVVALPEHKSTVTDKFGNFRLAIAADTGTITISSVGFIAQQIQIAGIVKPLIVELEYGNVDLKDVMICAYANNNSFHTISGIDLNLPPSKLIMLLSITSLV